jgi:hypothetical protein
MGHGWDTGGRGVGGGPGGTDKTPAEQDEVQAEAPLLPPPCTRPLLGGSLRPRQS